MYRYAYALLILALLVAGLAGCSPAPGAVATAPTPGPDSPPTAPTAAAFPVTIVDDGGTEVALLAEPQTIVSLTPSHTEILFALGLGDRVVGVTTFCDYPEEALAKEKVGSFVDIDLEKVVGLSPDLIFGTSLHSQGVAPALRERGLTVLLLEATNVETTLTEILTIGRATGRLAEAEALVLGIQARLDEVAAMVDHAGRRPRVFWELDPMLYTAGKDSFVDGLITLAGGENVGTRLEGEWPQFNLEALIEADPEVIVLADHGFGASAETVKARPGWSGLAAVRDGRIVEVEDVNLVSRPGPRVAEAVEYIARQLHPELFQGN
jgi:iron complex transport system substrate-binding protein